MNKLALGLSAAALAIGGTALAAHHEGHARPDGNGDDVVTRAESQAHALAMFAKFDANSDGQLDQADRALHREEMRKKMFAMLDTDKNGSLSRDEFMASQGPGKHRHGMGDAGHEGPGMHHRRGGRGHHGGMMMKMADANGDGQITSEERQAHRQDMHGKWRDRDDS